MPTYMDIHEIQGGITAEEVAKAHAHDVAVEGKYGVHYHRYWVNESAGKIFCLCEAPTAEAAMQVHREAHGQVAEKIIQVEPEVADLFLGGSERGRTITSKCELAARPGNRSNKTTIFLERLCNWRRGFVLTPNPTKSWYRPR